MVGKKMLYKTDAKIGRMNQLATISTAFLLTFIRHWAKYRTNGEKEHEMCPILRIWLRILDYGFV